MIPFKVSQVDYLLLFDSHCQPEEHRPDKYTSQYTSQLDMLFVVVVSLCFLFFFWRRRGGGGGYH